VKNGEGASAEFESLKNGNLFTSTMFIVF